MESITLEPMKHEPPVCDRYDHEETVRSFERAMRVHRAWRETWTITAPSARVDNAYRVVGASGSPYDVDIADGSTLHDACTCPDFLGGDLGTCKHLEAVRRAIATTPRLARTFARLDDKPTVPTITVDPVGGLRLRAVGRWTERKLAAVGLVLAGKGGTVEPTGGASLATGRLEPDIRIVRAAVPAAKAIHDGAALRARRQDVERLLERGRLGLDVVSFPLFAYQRDGVAHLLAAGRALLADDMGLGKTVQAIAACELLRARGEARRILIVTMASLKHQWAREIERAAGERAVVVSGGAAARRRALETDAPYVVLNYELTWRELSLLQALEADVVVYDEAQRAKNFRTKTAATLRAIPSRFTFVLTGTPVENRLDDLYALMQLVDPGVLGPLWKFNLAFHRQTERGRVVGYKNLSGLRQRTREVVLRRRKEEVLTQLPPITEQTRYTPLSKEQAALEAGYRQDAAKYISIAERRPLTKEEQQRMMAALLKARQACDDIELCDRKRRGKGSAKLEEFEALVREITEQGSNKVLVFSEWVEMLKLAARRLDALGVGYVTLHGGVPTEKRPALLDRFRELPDLRILLCTDAGGVGLNLQVASYVVHLDLPWNPARLDQRTGRAHRLGQTRGVSVTYLCAADGIERGIEGTLALKRAVRSAALDPASDTDTLDAQSFSVFLSQLRDVLGAAADPGEAPRGGEAPPTTERSPRTQADAAGVTPHESSEGPPELAAPRTLPAFPPPPAPPLLPVHSPAPPAAQAVSPLGAEHPAEPPRAVSPFDPGAPAMGGLPAMGGPPAAARPRTRAALAERRLELARVVLDAGFPADAVRAAHEALASAIGELLDAAPSGHAALVAAIYRELLPTGRLPHAAHAVLARLHDLASLEAHGVEVDALLASEAVREATEWVQRIGQRPAPEAAIA